METCSETVIRYGVAIQCVTMQQLGQGAGGGVGGGGDGVVVYVHPILLYGCEIKIMGVREDGCNLKTTASIFKTDLRCQSYNPNIYGAW